MINFSLDNLRKSWKEIYLSKPAKKRKLSKGIDGISLEDFKENENKYLQEIYRQLKGGFFVFDDLYYYQIRKGKKKPRDIQAPTVKDRIVQRIINKHILDFYLLKHFKHLGIVGSVEDTSVKKVIHSLLDFYNQGYIYVLKTDISDYFPTINPKRMKKIIGTYVKDEESRNFLYQYIKQTKRKGVPQGSPLSPTMANLYLISLDRYLSRRKTIKHIRYVDDILVFCKSKNDAKKTLKYLNRYMKSIDLKIHPLNKRNGKTLIDRFDSGKIEALGVTYKDKKLFIKPSKLKDFQEDIIAPIARVNHLKSLKGKTKGEAIGKLVKYLNHQITGWGGVYKFCDVTELYPKLDKKIDKNLKILLSRINMKSQIPFVLSRITKFVDVLNKPAKKPKNSYIEGLNGY